VDEACEGTGIGPHRGRRVKIVLGGRSADLLLRLAQRTGIHPKYVLREALKEYQAKLDREGVTSPLVR
jgi:hypothetical protein